MCVNVDVYSKYAARDLDRERESEDRELYVAGTIEIGMIFTWPEKKAKPKGK